MDQELAWW